MQRIRNMTRPGEATLPAASRLRIVHVSVRLFAGLRERAGTGARELELADGARVADVWSALDLGTSRPVSSTRSTRLRGRPSPRSPTATRWR